MKLYDISQEVFSCKVYPGDPAPKKEPLCSIAQGDLYNLTAFSMCAHNGTHIDAPYHFIEDGKTVDQLELSKTVGFAYVALCEGELTVADASRILQTARAMNREAAKRILLKGCAVVSNEAAELFSQAGLDLLGTELQTVGPADAPMAAHLALLSCGTVLLEGIRLECVPEGVYFLSAAPLLLSGADGSPCRALLIDFDS